MYLTVLKDINFPLYSATKEKGKKIKRNNNFHTLDKVYLILDVCFVVVQTTDHSMAMIETLNQMIKVSFIQNGIQWK